MDRSGNVFFVSGSAVVRRDAATGALTVAAAQLSHPEGLAIDAQGNLYIADTGNQLIRKVAAGTLTTVAGTGVAGYNGDSIPAAAAQLSDPAGLAIDRAGNLYIADAGNHRVRKVAAGIISTVAGLGAAGFSGDNGPASAAQLNEPRGVAVDAAGNLYIADTLNHRIRRVVNGVIATVAGTGDAGFAGDDGPASAAQLNGPRGVAVDAAGSLYIADTLNNRVRQVARGIISTVAGAGTEGFSGDSGPASSARLQRPTAVAVGAAGALYIADAGNDRVRLAAAAASPAANLTAFMVHAGSLALGVPISYRVTISNAASAGPTSGTVTVTDTLPTGLSLLAMSGSGWNCSGLSCSRSDALPPGGGYPAIVVAANVAADAPSPVTNVVTVSGGGAPTSSANETDNFTNSCSIALSPSAIGLPPTGTSTAETCPNNSGQPNCGVLPETPLSITVTPSGNCGTWTATSLNPIAVQVIGGASGNSSGTVTVVVLNNTHTTPQNYSLSIGNASAAAPYSIALAGSGNSQVYREVFALYESILGRDPDPAGFAYWTGSGGAGLGQMADSFLTSPEAFNSDFAVMAAYQAANAALPTFAQFTNSVAAVADGTQTVPGLFSAMTNNLPYATLFQNLLQRETNAGDSICIAQGQVSCFQDIIGFPSHVTPVGNQNNEYQSTGVFHTVDHTNATYIQMLYYLILGRDPDQTGLGFWTGIANTGGPGVLFQGSAAAGTRLQILGPGTPNQGFIGSPEFQGLFAN